MNYPIIIYSNVIITFFIYYNVIITFIIYYDVIIYYNAIIFIIMFHKTSHSKESERLALVMTSVAPLNKQFRGKGKLERKDCSQQILGIWMQLTHYCLNPFFYQILRYGLR